MMSRLNILLVRQLFSLPLLSNLRTTWQARLEAECEMEDWAERLEACDRGARWGSRFTGALCPVLKEKGPEVPREEIGRREQLAEPGVLKSWAGGLRIPEGGCLGVSDSGGSLDSLRPPPP
ncbi:hypothetical protein NDU88_000621 [Pleurodeles waltl]|uniref:Uncharacterized protein n=1 Tax=Pleurodeles waltl TaxID=8319 RepID=A0AAV7P4E9_PLEWA|nr:hypothetical protein NDU88_000621 [Pleurodeles waltl]